MTKTVKKTVKASPEIGALAELERKVAKMREEIDALKLRQPPTPPIFPKCPFPHPPFQQWPPTTQPPWAGYPTATWI